MANPEKGPISAALDEVIFGPFRKSADRRRPLLCYGVFLVILVFGAFLLQTKGLIVGGTAYMVIGLSWSAFCRWRKWA
ncbi:hypothetical protein [Aquidulcibacter sp.]|uniref:hypothetical protein n=1 Tax=Aquidulcibacter sp. TaxID=2052990 RepID=UPI0025B8B612|nr:hypothetical protein [Aquidulcibacter sp.]